jgi:hypothetical protein
LNASTGGPRQPVRPRVQAGRQQHHLPAAGGAPGEQLVVVEPGPHGDLPDQRRPRRIGRRPAGGARRTGGGHERRRVRVAEQRVGAAGLGGPDPGDAQRGAAHPRQRFDRHADRLRLR